MTAEIEVLALAIKQRRAILFAGAGVSMSVGLPSWKSLMEHMGEELGLDRGAIGSPNCSYQMLAEFYRIKRGNIGPIRSWMDRNWTVSREDVDKSRVHDLIIELDFPVIYTTNYDRNLEVAFELRQKEFMKVVNAKDLSRPSDGVTQIVKYHGDFDDDASLVLAETDYFDRLSFDSPLDVKFRADALGRTVLFVGYSMSDMNIRLLLHRVWQTWNKSPYEKDRPRPFVFMPCFDPIQEAILGRWGITLLSETAENSESALRDFLEKLKRKVDEIP